MRLIRLRLFIDWFGENRKLLDRPSNSSAKFPLAMIGRRASIKVELFRCAQEITSFGLRFQVAPSARWWFDVSTTRACRLQTDAAPGWLERETDWCLGWRDRDKGRVCPGLGLMAYVYLTRASWTIKTRGGAQDKWLEDKWNYSDAI